VWKTTNAGRTWLPTLQTRSPSPRRRHRGRLVQPDIGLRVPRDAKPTCGFASRAHGIVQSSERQDEATGWRRSRRWAASRRSEATCVPRSSSSTRRRRRAEVERVRLTAQAADPVAHARRGTARSSASAGRNTGCVVPTPAARPRCTALVSTPAISGDATASMRRERRDSRPASSSHSVASAASRSAGFRPADGRMAALKGCATFHRPCAR